MGDSVTVRLGLTFRPTPRLRRTTPICAGADRSGSAEAIFTNNIARSTFNFQFTRELSVRAIADYNAVIPILRVQLTNDKRVGADLLFTYQVGPSRLSISGYTTGFQNLSPFEPAFRQRASPSRPRRSVASSSEGQLPVAKVIACRRGEVVVRRLRVEPREMLPAFRRYDRSLVIGAGDGLDVVKRIEEEDRDELDLVPRSRRSMWLPRYPFFVLMPGNSSGFSIAS